MTRHNRIFPAIAAVLVCAFACAAFATIPTSQPAPTSSVPPPSRSPAITQVAIGMPIPANVRVFALQRGGEWPGIALQSGMEITAWGDLAKPRPVLISTDTAVAGMGTSNATITDCTLKATSHRAQVVHLYGCTDIELVHCEITGGASAVTSEAPVGKRANGLLVCDCDIHDIWAIAGSGNSEGIYTASTDGFRCFRNIFQRVGYNPGGVPYATVLNHAIYHQAKSGPADIENNIFQFISSHAIQQRAGGTMKHNMTIEVPLAFAWGAVSGAGPVHNGGCIGDVTENVAIGSSPIMMPTPQIRGFGLTVANSTQCAVVGNLFYGDANSRFYALTLGNCDGTFADDAVGLRKVTVANNKVWGWKGGAFSVTKPVGKQTAREITNVNNVWGGTSPANPNLRTLVGVDPIGYVRSGKTTTEALVQLCLKASIGVH